MRPRIILALTMAGLVGVTAAIVPADAKPRTAARYYFHTGVGSYLDDWKADPGALRDLRAPAGSVMSTKAPARTTDATALSNGHPRVIGAPQAPSFALPFTGTLKNICLDFWARGQTPINYVASTQKAPPVLTSLLSIATKGTIPSAQVPFGVAYPISAGDGWPTDGTSLARRTKLLTFPAPVVVQPNSVLLFGTWDFPLYTSPNWTMSYDTRTHPSSVSFNVKSCTPLPVGKQQPAL